MKLARYGAAGRERPTVLDGAGRLRDLSGLVADVDGASLSDGLIERLKGVDLSTLPLVDEGERLGPCVGRVGKIVAVGLNYAEHAREGGRDIPQEPLLFMKATSSISGPDDPIVLPRGSEKTDWEVELAVVIGRTARYVEEDAALGHVAGYALFNDLSERDHQLNRGGQWTKGKGHDSFGPLGPWLVTADELGDPGDIDLWLEVDGERHQAANTSDMIFCVARLVSYISTYMTLDPGDVIITGTPSGVGNGIRPEPKFLRAGQTVRLGGTRLGIQTHTVVAEGGVA
ncbi:fumarylacetoacetate hydrolase family protein [Frigidibacter sp. SD6-1]|uniref:fumarylacetoacetate hydrolase family protein n=1 Tax=Frigidibacter sp. SD6-1 TaxID=3032581 RepID=UPI0024DF812E|nr:fumarylacetoacetate hydrolase family protein [Frigidibacter sp. SD6-1]